MLAYTNINLKSNIFVIVAYPFKRHFECLCTIIKRLVAIVIKKGFLTVLKGLDEETKRFF